MKLLIAHDGSSGADSILQDLARAGLPAELDAVVLTVADVWMPPIDATAVPNMPEWSIEAGNKARAAAAQAVEQARATATRVSQQLQQHFPRWRIAVQACADSPAWAITQHAEKIKADLVAVGSHGHSALGRLVLGSVAQKVVSNAPCAVRVCRSPVRQDTECRVIIGIDGSACAEIVVQTVAQRRWPAGSSIRVVTALGSPWVAPADFPNMLAGQWLLQDPADEEAWADQMFAAAQATLRATELTVTSVAKPGDAKSVLLNEAETWKADCIFVGARGLRGIDRFLLGSVSSVVTARAMCSVEVVRERGVRVIGDR